MINENIVLQSGLWTRDVTIDHFREKYRASAREVHTLRNERSILHQERKQDRAIIESLVVQTESDAKTIKRQRITIGGLSIGVASLLIATFL
jgi:hypothetical protein